MSGAAVSPWLNSSGLADYIGAPTAKAARMWALRHGVVAVHRDRRVLYARADVEAVLLRAREADLARLRRAAISDGSIERRSGRGNGRRGGR
jgi:hypothetical protein